MLPVKYQFIWPSGFRGEDFSISANQKQELSMAAIIVDGSGRMRKLDTGPLIDASCQISVHLAQRCQRRRFFYFSQSEIGITNGGHVC